MVNDNNLLIVDPNPIGNKKLELEDLNISVELEVYSRDNVILLTTNNDDGTSTTEKVNKPRETTRVSFIDTSNSELFNATGGTKTYLNTHYTELNTQFGKNNPDVSALGIESIDINFNTSYVPIVKIKFRDVRGKLFEYGTKSPFAFLFEIPYPIFYLTVKGYLGQPVQFALHLTKFNGMLDNITGSFIIDCDFIGYTYAFLSDLLMTFIKAVPYTSEGKKLIAKDETFITIKELNTSIKKLEELIKNYKKDNNNLKAVAVYTDLSSKLNDIQGSIESLSENFEQISNGNSYGKDNIIYYKYNNLEAEKEKFTGVIDTYTGSVMAKIKDFNQLATVNYQLPEEEYEVTFNNDRIIYHTNVSDAFKDIPEKQETDNNGVLITTPSIEKTWNDAKKHYEYIPESSFTNIRQTINNKDFFPILDFGVGIKSGVIIIDFDSIIKKIRDKKVEISNKLDEVKVLLKEDFNTQITKEIEEREELIDPSIGNIFKILSKHVDILLGTIKEVANKARKDGENGNRHPLLIENNASFPDYWEKNGVTGVESDTWIGKLDNSLAEVVFIDDLYKSILKSRREDDDFISGFGGVVDKWYPINPMDSPIFDNAIINPWELINNNNIEIISKIIIQRMSVFLGYSNKTLTPDEITLMGKIEANETFKNILNKDILRALTNGDVSVRIEEILKYASELGVNFTNGIYYHYYDNTDNINNYLPISQTLADIISKTPTITSATTTSNLIGSTLIGDNGKIGNETFIKILTESEYSGEFTYPTYDGVAKTTFNDGKYFVKEFLTPIEFYSPSTDVVKNYRPNPTVNVEYDTFINENGIYKLKTKITPCGTEKDRNSLIKIGGSDKTELANRLIDTNKPNKLYNLENIFNSMDIPYSLFGSDFYYGQSNIGKAFLFLNTIPFEGMDKGGLLSDKVLKFFNNNAGFVKVPYSWILFLGAIIHRMESPTEILKFNEDDFSLIPNYPSNVTWNKEKYLMNEGHTGGLSFNQINRNFPTVEISLLIKTLPVKVKLIFMNEFRNWVDDANGFQLLKEKLEIFKDGTTHLERISAWLNIGYNLSGKNSSNTTIPVTLPTQFKTTIGDNYRVVSQSLEFNNNSIINEFKVKNHTASEYLTLLKDKNTGSPINFFLELNEDINGGGALLTQFLNKNRVIANATYRIWDKDVTSDDISTQNSSTIIVNEADKNTYLKSYITTLTTLLIPAPIGSSDDINKKIFNILEIDDVKLSLYKNIKSIFDKWIVGIDDKTLGTVSSNLFKHFRFIDRAHRDISNIVKINPAGFSELLASSHNVSFHAFIASILADNHFDFIPLPTYVNYEKESDVAKIFKPVRYNNMDLANGPQFICMYIGERSNKLDLSVSGQDKGKENLKDDSFTITTIIDVNGNVVFDKSKAPDDFIHAINEKSEPSYIPYFLVKYGDQNQSIFKNIKLNQSEFTETNESLQIIEDLSTRNRNSSLGQNMFDIYNNRSYSAEIEMLGCSQIQPFMYFQIDDVPMFRGAYTIINTTHHIAPNTMTTTFKGVRIRKVATKFVDDITVYYNLLANLDEVSTEGYVDSGNNTTTANSSTPNVSEDSVVDSEIVNDFNFSNPVANMRITAPFGYGLGPNGQKRNHTGIDVGIPTGTPIYSIGNGIITRVRYEGKGIGGGLYIQIKYISKLSNVKDKTYYVRYMHLSNLADKEGEIFYNLKVGDTPWSEVTSSFDIQMNKIVKKLDTIGYSGGDSGTIYAGTSGAAHLHLDIRTSEGLSDFKNPAIMLATVTDAWTYKPPLTASSIV